MTGKPPGPLLIEDDEVRDLAATLAGRLGTTEQFAIKAALAAEIKRLEVEPTAREKLDALLEGIPKPSDGRKPVSPRHPSVKERLEDLYRRYPKPDPTGVAADKAFFDEMSGETQGIRR
jgi:antitoxin VapB